MAKKKKKNKRQQKRTQNINTLKNNVNQISKDKKADVIDNIFSKPKEKSKLNLSESEIKADIKDMRDDKSIKGLMDTKNNEIKDSGVKDRGVSEIDSTIKTSVQAGEKIPTDDKGLKEKKEEINKVGAVVENEKSKKGKNKLVGFKDDVRYRESLPKEKKSNILLYLIIFIIIVVLGYMAYIWLGDSNRKALIDDMDISIGDNINIDTNDEDIIKKTISDISNIPVGLDTDDAIQIINRAKSDLDLEICNEIDNSIAKKICQDSAYSSLAYAKRNMDYCYDIDDKDTKLSCLNNLSYNLALEQRDYDLCLDIENDDLLYECNRNIIIPMLDDIDMTDRIICSNLRGADRELCNNNIDNNIKLHDIDVLQLAKDNNNPDTCISIINSNLRDDCIFILSQNKDISNYNSAIDSSNISICEMIGDESIKMDCIDTISMSNDNSLYYKAMEEDDEIYCENIGDVDIKNECQDIFILKEILASGLKELCEDIQTDDLRKECQDVFIDSDK